MIPKTVEEKIILELSHDQLKEITDTLRSLKGNGFSIPITAIKLTYPPKTSIINAWNPATRGHDDIKVATFYLPGQGGGQLAQTLKLAVEYLDLLPVAVSMLRQAIEDANELECVTSVLDNVDAPTVIGQDINSGQDVLYTVHARVKAALDKARAGK